MRHTVDAAELQGHGFAFSESVARTIAIVEAAERYATSVASRAIDPIWLSDYACSQRHLDLSSIPQLSDTELSHPKCRYIRPDKRKPIRWTRGVDLRFGEVTLLPWVMVFLGDPTWSENFWIPISTGSAANRSLAAALVAGICEVIERDALSLAWLQRAPLPRVDPASYASESRMIVDWCHDNFLEPHLFDATTDLGVPTVLCVLLARHAARAAQIVACATHLDGRQAATKALAEAVNLRAVLAAHEPPERPEDFTSLVDGAAFMGRAEHFGAFDFLLSDPSDRPKNGLRSVGSNDPEQNLALLLSALVQSDMAVYAADLTTIELDAVGLRAVRVLIPQLQPFSPIPLAQFRRSKRLYTCVFGHTCTSEDALNPWPIPFA